MSNANFIIAPANLSIFSNTLTNDTILYTNSSNLRLGNTVNAVAPLNITSNAVYTSNVNFGINNSNPQYTLDIVGTARSTTFIGDGSQLTNIPFGFRCAVFSTAGAATWTVPVGVYWIKITGTAGGGGGAGIAAAANFGGSGGASGGTQIWRGQVTPGWIFNITVGAGGAGGASTGANGSAGGTTQVYISTTYYINVSGGGGGYIPQANTTPGGQYIANGSSLAQINMQGASAVGMSTSSTFGGNGAASYFGGGGAGGDANVVGNGANPGANYGSGGGGARYAASGAIGAAGVVIIEY